MMVLVVAHYENLMNALLLSHVSLVMQCSSDVAFR